MKTDWYLTRSSGAVSLVLLTAALVIGIALVGRVRTDRWPRFAVDGIHRAVSLLAIVFLVPVPCSLSVPGVLESQQFEVVQAFNRCVTIIVDDRAEYGQRAKLVEVTVDGSWRH